MDKYVNKVMRKHLITRNDISEYDLNIICNDFRSILGNGKEIKKRKEKKKKLILGELVKNTELKNKYIHKFDILDKILVDNIPKYVMILINSYVQFTPNCKSELQIAVKEWNQSPDKAFKKYGDVRFWDVSKVTDMSSLFFGLESFNENISSWDVSNVEYMSFMFYDAKKFNSPLRWDVRNVKYMNSMFRGADSFEKENLEKWEKNSIVSDKNMFVDRLKKVKNKIF